MRLTVEGLGFWASGLPDAAAARAFLRSGALPEAAPRKPVATLLPANERRRAPDTVALALAVAEAACREAGRAPQTLPSVFASTHGDLAITDYICTTLAEAPRSVSPTRFHNSVHNAAAGYWTIGTGCMQPATAISAFRGSFAQALIEAAAHLADDAEALLLVAYDAESAGALAPTSRSEGLLAGALVLSRAEPSGQPSLTLQRGIDDAAPDMADDPLSQRLAGNAMAPMLPLFAHLLAGTAGTLRLPAGARGSLRVELSA